jgi:hexosaminidase
MIPEVNGEAVQNKDVVFAVPEEMTVLLKGFTAETGENVMKVFTERTGTGCRIREVSDHESVRMTDLAPGNEMMIEKDMKLAEEGYRLEVTENSIRITAGNEKGIIWALTTIYQLMDEQKNVPCVSMTDAPRLSYRGIMLDCVRHFFSVQEVKKVIEEMSLVKLNVLHWHLADDQGFRIESRKYPLLHSQCGSEYYSQEQIREIVAYADQRGVEVIPEIDMPGHTSAILAAYPEYGCRGERVALPESGGIYPIVLCPGKEKTYEFLDGLLGEVSALFTSGWFHIGGDEAPDREWKICSDCRRKMQEEGLTDTRQLQGYFSERVRNILRGYGKKVICWNDSLEASNFIGQGKTDDKTLVQFWSVQYADSMISYLRKGGKFIYSDMFELYLDYPCSMNSMKKIYHCRAEIRKQIYESVQNLKGMEACLWTEHVVTDSQLEERLFPRIYALAENTWSGDCGYDSFCTGLQQYIAGKRKGKAACLTLSQADPKGEARKQELMEYMSSMQSNMSDEMKEMVKEFTKPSEEFAARFQEKFLKSDE